MGVVSEQNQLRDYDFDLSENLVFNYQGTNHVRVLKRFVSVPDPNGDPIEADLLKIECNGTFHLRFYIPKAALTSKDHKIKDLVIMFNGLNETDRFDLYDILGQHLAEQGIAAVLLPTPFHLNRSGMLHILRHRKEFKRAHEYLFKAPMLMYYNYKQSMLDSSLLISKVRQENEKEEEWDFGFYTSLFDRNARISILGFSLGGLRALASFIHEPDKYHSCIVFNSGVELALLNTESIAISTTDWKGFVDNLRNVATSQNPKPGADNYWSSFNQVFLGEWPHTLRDRLQKNSQRLLFIVSGGDPIFSPDLLKYLSVEGHGLTVLQIAGVGHIPTSDPRWGRWINLVSEFILGYVSHTGRRIWSRQDIVNEVGKVLEDTKYLTTLRTSKKEFGATEFRNLLNQLAPQNRDTLIRLFYASIAYYPGFREVLNGVVKRRKKAKQSQKAKSQAAGK